MTKAPEIQLKFTSNSNSTCPQSHSMFHWALLYSPLVLFTSFLANYFWSPKHDTSAKILQMLNYSLQYLEIARYI